MNSLKFQILAVAYPSGLGGFPEPRNGVREDEPFEVKPASYDPGPKWRDYELSWVDRRWVDTLGEQGKPEKVLVRTSRTACFRIVAGTSVVLVAGCARFSPLVSSTTIFKICCSISAWTTSQWERSLM